MPTLTNPVDDGLVHASSSVWVVWGVLPLGRAQVIAKFARIPTLDELKAHNIAAQRANYMHSITSGSYAGTYYVRGLDGENVYISTELDLYRTREILVCQSMTTYR